MFISTGLQVIRIVAGEDAVGAVERNRAKSYLPVSVGSGSLGEADGWVVEVDRHAHDG